MEDQNKRINILVSAFGKEKLWINWQLEEKEGKLDKIPKMSNGHGNAKPNDPSTWSTFADVDAVRNRFSGIGIMLNDKLLGIDLDHCIVDGEVSAQVATFIERARTYTEISPSGTGLHVYLPLTEPMTLERNKAPRGIGADYECYTTGRWFTFSANPWKESYELRTATPEEALDLLGILGYPWKKNQTADKTGGTLVEVTSPLTDSEVLKKMFASKNGTKIRALHDGDVSTYGNDDSSADLALCSYLAFWTGRSISQIERIWLDSPLGQRSKTQERKDYRERTINTAIEGCRETYSKRQSKTKTLKESVTDTEEKGQDTAPEMEDESQKRELMKLVTANPDIELFRDNYGNGHARVTVDGHKEIMVCKGTRFKQWLSHSYLEQYDKIADPGPLSTAIFAIESKAAFKGKEYKLYNRVAKVGDTIWFDLADDRNRAVRITAAGWDIIDEPPILFRRHAHQKEQVEPQRGGDINELFEFVNVTEPTHRLLLLVYLVSCFVPDFPHALLYIHGQQGSSKSTLCRILRRLGDPSRTEVLHMPKDERELKLQLSRHHLIFYENVDGISNAISTVLCIGVTGGSSSERLYFTNGEDFIFDFQLNIGINGINISAVKPDLLERSLLFELKRMDEKNRRDEAEIFEGFELVRPKILGAILDVVVRALAIRPSVKLAKKPRMADFALWGVAIAEALGHDQQEFLDAYNQKIEEQSNEALSASMEAQMLIKFMEGRVFLEEPPYWEGTNDEFLRSLRTEAENQNGGKVPKHFPEQSNQLTRRLNVLKPNLEAVGYKFSSFKSGGVRYVRVERVTTNTVQSVPIVPLVQNDKDSVDGVLPAGLPL